MEESEAQLSFPVSSSQYTEDERIIQQGSKHTKFISLAVETSLAKGVLDLTIATVFHLG